VYFPASGFRSGLQNVGNKWLCASVTLKMEPIRAQLKLVAEIISFLQRVRTACNADRCMPNRYGLSVCPSVCLSVTFRCFVQTNEDTIVRFSTSGRKAPLSLTKIWPIIGHNLETVQNGRYVSTRKSHMTFDWYQNRWPWMTLNGAI